ncbi:unnamed protein product [Cuscuta europaea]|uniref:DYW domain-containing protein n=1 Tax=Cuscuta europaea TaxID=41803 RepID=A0A9P0ZTF8_CUSEU|nr:unnamed protein product [Cuscuta europaea]
MNLATTVVPKSLVEIKAALFQGFESFNHFKHIHARLLRSGLHQNNYLLNQLLMLTLNSFHNPDYAKLLFSQTLEPNIFLWNTMIRGLVTNDCFDLAIEVFNSMRQMSYLPNNFTFPFLLKSCARISDYELGINAHGLVVKTGFGDDPFVSTGLVCFYAKCGCLQDAHKVFDGLPEKNVVSWTSIMGAYVAFGRFREAVVLFCRCVGMGLVPDSFILVRVLSACGHLGDIGTGEWVHKYILDTCGRMNVFVGTSLVDMYSKCGNMEKARHVFEEMSEKDIVSWSAMIQGYAANGLPKEALDLFYRMQRSNMSLDCYSMVGVLSACGRLGALNVGILASNLIDKKEFHLNPVLGTSLIDMYARCGEMNFAWAVFKEMKVRDCVVWNAMISGLAMHGHVRSSFSCFAQLEKHGIPPDGNTFMGLLCACTHAGLLNEGRRFFDSMVQLYFLKHDIQHYGCMVDLLGRAGRLEEAHSLITRMPMKANAVIWGALLAGCRLYRDTKLAEHVLKELIKLEPWNCGNYVLLANIYSADRKWNDSEKIRSDMNKMKIQKLPACSWIEVGGKVHEFLVGDRRHPMSDQIHGKLGELEKGLREAGYVPETEYVLFDIEEEEKEYFVGCHSEKLAVAFGLISSTKPEDVIRVIKNLRICGDCHTAIKLISKITAREIIVRDTNRFHHFVDGSCSCREYW